MTDEQFGWYEDDHPAHGPFPTFEAAEEDARDCGMHVVNIGAIKTIHPAEWIDTDVERILEQMDESISSDVAFDDAVFVLKKESEAVAEDELKLILEEWANKYVTTNSASWYIPDGEEVVL